MFYPRRGRFASGVRGRPIRGRRGRGRYGKKRALKGFTKQQSKSIMRAISGKEETKYYAEQLATNQVLDAPIHTPNTDMLPLVPAIPQGNDEWQRNGRKVTPVKCKVDVSLTFPQVDYGVSSPPPESLLANAIYAVIYIVRSKTQKSWVNFAASQEWQSLLDDGQGHAQAFGKLIPDAANPGTNFIATDMSLLQYPIETSHYTLVRKKVVKLVRNVGNVRDGVPGDAPNMSQSFWRGSFKYRLPTLQYDDTKDAQTGNRPTNANLMICFGYVFADNLTSENALATGGVTSSAQLLSVTCRNHVWYKDA